MCNHSLMKAAISAGESFFADVMNVAVAESMHVQQVCKYKGQLDPKMTVVAIQHTTRVPYVSPPSLMVTRDTVPTVCARRDADSSYL